jgi:nicotinate phosphoribosyltransferase
MAHHKFIINHLTDTDFYKYTMGQAIFHNIKNAHTKWELTIRSKGVKTGYLKDEVNYQIDHLCELKHGTDELQFLDSIPYLTYDFIEYLEDFRLKRKYINVESYDDQLHITAEGPEERIHWYETLVMPIVQELWMADQEGVDYELGKKNLDAAIDKYNKLWNEGKKFQLADFGTRRRASYDWHEYVVRRLIEKCLAFVGTSNVYLAMKFGVKPIGTFAHSWKMLFQGLKGIRTEDSQEAAFETWAKEFDGDLGIFLSDTYGFLAFLKAFTKRYMKLASGARHDSNDPFLWGDLFIAALKYNQIDPMTKVACFSDSLNDDKVVDIVNYFWNRILISIGQGTFLTNNVGGNPLNMVMKMQEVNGIKAVKMSDCPGKTNCHDEDRIKEIIHAFNYTSLDEIMSLKGDQAAIADFIKRFYETNFPKKHWRP